MKGEDELLRNEAENIQLRQNNGEFCAATKEGFFCFVLGGNKNHDNDKQDIIDIDHTCQMYSRQLSSVYFIFTAL